jgi:hypothetical protein
MPQLTRLIQEVEIIEQEISDPVAELRIAVSVRPVPERLLELR